MLEANRFVVAPEFQNLDNALKLYIFRVIAETAEVHQIDYVFAAVRPKHVRYYQRFYFEPVSVPKDYPLLRGQFVLMCTHWPSSYPKAIQRYPLLSLCAEFSKIMDDPDSFVQGLL